MSVYYNNKKCVPFYNDWRPLKVMKDGKEVAGWSTSSNSLPKDGSNYTYIQNTYNDYLSFTVHGRATQKQKDNYALYTNPVLNPAPYRYKLGNITVTDFTVLTNLGNNGLHLQLASSKSSGSIEFATDNVPFINDHKYLIACNFTGAMWNEMLFINEIYNYESFTRYDLWSLHCCIVTGNQLNSHQYKIQFDNIEAVGQTRIVILYGFEIIDLNMLWGGYYLNDSLQNIMGRFHNLSISPFHREYSDPYKKEVDYQAHGGDLSPFYPQPVYNDYVSVYTSKSNFYLYDLNFGDEYHNSTGNIHRYGKQVKLKDLNWNYNGRYFYVRMDDMLGGVPEKRFCTHYPYIEGGYTPFMESSKSYCFAYHNFGLILRDFDCNSVDELKESRGESIIYYRGNTGDAEYYGKAEVLTSPYQTYLSCNADITYTYKHY